MPKLTEYELQRQANIARNHALLAELNFEEAAAGLVSRKSEAEAIKSKAKPIQPAKRVKRERNVIVEPRRQSLRLRDAAESNGSPSKKRKIDRDEEKQRQIELEERLEAEERARQARKPRHQDLDLKSLSETADMSPEELSALTMTLQTVAQKPQPRRTAEYDAFIFDDEVKEEQEVTRLKESLKKLKVASRAKVTQDRVYSAAYHPEKSKDLIFFGDKHGQLGIWDAQAPADEIEDEDGDVAAPDEREGGKYWRLQPHWPATSKSSISAIKLDPINSHSLFTSAYDCTIRSTSITTNISREVFAIEDRLISSFDLPPTGQELWISDAKGGLTHVDLRQDKSTACRWELSDQKIGCVSINPSNPDMLLLASNDRSLKIWDARMLQEMPASTVTEDFPPTFELEVVTKYEPLPKGKGLLVAEWPHNKSVSAAYWDPRGRSIVSTCYDDKLRLWDAGSEMHKGGIFRAFKPFCNIQHNCQTVSDFELLSHILDSPFEFSDSALDIFRDTIFCFDGVFLSSLMGAAERGDGLPSSRRSGRPIPTYIRISRFFHPQGDVLARLSDSKRISAVQAVTCSHPSIVERAASGNASGRCVLWAPASTSD
ncbi:hypothetical protein EW145_g4564 [Phellinidium pouzarii]|uniref:DNA damage-binding protein CMR1 n=1 Tax=Phellinidium pouzarii TaxID=167371 RepID=A0A4S4L390_9AGAM|nr:hypothetical protein EW145_g4564 [Phellinidium pouzarii]